MAGKTPLLHSFRYVPVTDVNVLSFQGYQGVCVSKRTGCVQAEACAYVPYYPEMNSFVAGSQSRSVEKDNVPVMIRHL